MAYYTIVCKREDPKIPRLLTHESEEMVREMVEGFRLKNCPYGQFFCLVAKELPEAASNVPEEL